MKIFRRIKGGIWYKIKYEDGTIKWKQLRDKYNGILDKQEIIYKMYSTLYELKPIDVEDYNSYKSLNHFNLDSPVLFRFERIPYYTEVAKYIVKFYNPFLNKWIKFPDIERFYNLSDWSLNMRISKVSYGEDDYYYTTVWFNEIESFKSNFSTYRKIQEHFDKFKALRKKEFKEKQERQEKYPDII